MNEKNVKGKGEYFTSVILHINVNFLWLKRLKHVLNSQFWLKIIIELRHYISNNVVCATSKASDQPAHTHILIRAFASHLNIL